MPDRAALVLLALWPIFAAADGGESSPAPWKLSGYYKNLLTRSQTILPPHERLSADLNRLRLKIEGKPAEDLAVDLQYDNELLLESHRDTTRHRFYRATATWSLGATDVRIGRQRIAWGTGRFFSPLDILNPFSPISLERAERPGVDALLVERKLDALSRLSAVYVPRHDDAPSSAAAQWHGNYRGVDYSVTGGRFRQNNVVGLDLAGQWGQAGVRAELTHTRRPSGRAYTRALLGLDYAFENTLALSGELYRDGSGAQARSDYDFQGLLAGRLVNVGRHYAAARAGYELTPLVKANVDLVGNLRDRSYYCSPSLTWSIRADLDATLGVQWFRGRAGSEYGAFRDTAYLQLVWFF